MNLYTTTVAEANAAVAKLREQEIRTMLKYKGLKWEDVRDQISCDISPKGGIEAHSLGDEVVLTIDRVLDFEKSVIRYDVVRHYEDKAVH